MDRLRPLVLAVLALALACQGESGDGDDAGAPAEPGDQLWARSIVADGIALAVDWHGNIAVVGNEDGGLWLGRFSAEGEPLWSRTEPGVLALTVATDVQRIIYAAGALGIESPAGGRISAYDLDGTHRWTLDDPARTPRALAAAPGGGVFAVGPVAGEPGIFIERVLPSGDVQWSLTEDDVAGEWLDADVWADGLLLITGSRDDGSWWMHARTALGDKLWTAELGEVVGPGFPAVAHGATRIHASILGQGEGPRGLVAAVSPWGGAVEWIQPLERAPTDLAVGDSGSILLAGLVSPSITALGDGGATEWSIEPDEACPKTYAVARRSSTDAVLLRACTDGGSQLALVQTQ